TWPSAELWPVILISSPSPPLARPSQTFAAQTLFHDRAPSHAPHETERRIRHRRVWSCGTSCTCRAWPASPTLVGVAPCPSRSPGIPEHVPLIPCTRPSRPICPGGQSSCSTTIHQGSEIYVLCRCTPESARRVFSKCLRRACRPRRGG